MNTGPLSDPVDMYFKRIVYFVFRSTRIKNSDNLLEDFRRVLLNVPSKRLKPSFGWRNRIFCSGKY